MSVNNLADEMLSRIQTSIDTTLQSTPHLRSAIVASINQNGTINVYIPPNNTKIFTNISNQTPFTLNPGDSVELMLKDGSFSNCWIVAKHQSTMDMKNLIKDVVIEVLQEKGLI